MLRKTVDESVYSMSEEDGVLTFVFDPEYIESFSDNYSKVFNFIFDDGKAHLYYMYVPGYSWTDDGNFMYEMENESAPGLQKNEGGTIWVAPYGPEIGYVANLVYEMDDGIAPGLQKNEDSTIGVIPPESEDVNTVDPAMVISVIAAFILLLIVIIFIKRKRSR